MLDLRRTALGSVYNALGLAVLLATPTLSAATPSEISEARSLTAVYYETPAGLNRLGTQLDVWHVDRANGFAAVYLRADQRATLEAEGFAMRPLSDAMGLPEAALDERFFHYDSFVPSGRNRYLVDVLGTVESFRPDLTEVIDIGDAWEATDGGYPRDIWVVRVTNEDPAFGPIDEKPAFFLFANMHAREVATPELVLRYLRYLMIGYRGQGGYGDDPDVTWLVDHHVAYLLIMQNPDGHAVNEVDVDAFRRKNLNDTDGCGFGSLLGVDLNRNHSYQWGCCNGSSGDACSETFRGSAPASEPETQAFQSFFASVMEDQNGPNGDNEVPPAAPEDTEGIFISLHAYGDLVLWPWQVFDFGLAPNANGLTRIGRKFGYYNDYQATDGNIGYEADGATDDWVYGKFGIPAYTFEVGGGFGSCFGFFPDYRCLDGLGGRDFWAENGPAFRYAHQIAAAPYRISMGPDTFGLRVSGDALSAVVEDRRIAGETERDILGAEYFVGAPGPEGSGAPLSPADGAWGERREAIEGSIDIGGLPPGEHYVLVRGRTSAGWGPLSAVWITVG